MAPEFSTYANADSSGATKERSEDLWQRALESLQADLRSTVSIHTTDNRQAVLETVLYEAKDKREQCLRKRWKITKRNGDIIVLRDVFEKIIKWVDKFKAIGDAATNPNHAALPWSVVCVLIKASISDSEIFAAMIEGLEKVTNIISRYAIFEDVYFRQRTSASDYLRDSLTKLYASVLTFLAKSHKYFGDKTAKRMLKSFLGQSVSDVEETLNNVEERQVEVDRTAQLVGMEILHNTSTGVGSLNTATGRMTSQLEIMSSRLVDLQHGQVSTYDIHTMREAIASLMGPTERILANLSRYDDFLTQESRKDIFDWLSPIRYKVYHFTERQDRLIESGQWMFQSEMFRKWQDSSISGTLWLHGMPGSGKSKLASAVIDDEIRKQMQMKSKNSELAPVAYFYCSRNKAEPERSDPDDILRCIARQLCGDDPTRTINEFLSQVHSQMDKPRPGESKLPLNLTVQLILRALQDNPGTIVIDALDECDPGKRYILFETLDTIVKESCNVVKVFLTSRNDGDIVCRLSSTPNIYIDAQKNKADIERFIETEVEKAVAQRRMLNGTVSEELQMRITTTLNHHARGMFRWVSLQIQNLSDPRRMKIEEDILHELLHLPKSLSDLYSIVFDQIFQLGHSSYQLALTSLQLLIVAVRPISWEEFLYMLSLSESAPRSRQLSKSEILNIASNFLEDDKAENRPKFVHLSAREYLESRQEFVPELSNMKIASICLNSLWAEPTLETCCYSTFYLGNHLAGTSPSKRLEFRALLWKFLVSDVDNQKIENSKVVTNHSVSNFPSLFLVWRGRIERLVGKGYLAQGQCDSAEMCQATLVSKTPSLTVCVLGLQEMLSALPFIDIKTRVYDDFLYNPITHYLSWSGREAMYPYKLRTSLELAVLFNRPGILRQYHALGHDLNMLTYQQETLLHLASKSGFVEVVDTLLCCGMKPDVLTGSMGRKETLPKGKWDYVNENPEIPGWSSWGNENSVTPSQECPVIRSQTSLGFRTYHGGASGVYSPFNLDRAGKTALHTAMERDECIPIVKTLIKHGADVNARTINGTSTLQIALDSGKNTNQLFLILLKAGARPNDRLHQNQTILHLAAAMNWEETVRILLSAGADPSIKDNQGQTAGALAMRYGNHTQTAKLLGIGGPPNKIQLPRKPIDSLGVGESRRAKSNGDVPSIVVEESDSSLPPQDWSSIPSTTFDDVHSPPMNSQKAAEKKRSKRSTISEWWALKRGLKR